MLNLSAYPLHVNGVATCMPDAGHAPYFEKPEAFNRAVIDFLTALE